MATGGGAEERNALTILWRIENLSCFEKGFHGDCIWSDSFYPHSLEDKVTELYLYPRDETVNDRNVSLFLGTCSPFPLECEFSFLTCDGSPPVTCNGIRHSKLGYKFYFRMTHCLTHEELFVTKKSTFLHHDTLTVRCRLWKSEGNFPHKESISIRSQIEVSEGSILWPIAGCSGLELNLSQTFPLRLYFLYGLVRFNLKCSLIGGSLQKAELNIEVTAHKLLRVFLVKLEVSVLGNGQEVVKLEVNKNVFSKSKIEQSWVVPKFVFGENLREKISLLECEENISLLFHLTAVFKDIWRCREKANIVTSHTEHVSARTTSTFSEASCQTSEQNGDTLPDVQQINECLGVLGEDLFSLYEKQTFSDFELSAGEVCFPVHKVVLSARSPVFCSMFSNEMEESSSKSLDIPDLDAHALNRLLTFLYRGTVERDLTLQSAANLYYAADKYQVDTLKLQCSSILKSQICVSNVSDILTLADRHQDPGLTSFVHNFILSHFDDVMDSTEWEKFMDTNSALAGKSTLMLYKERKSHQKNS